MNPEDAPLPDIAVRQRVGECRSFDPARPVGIAVRSPAIP